MKNQVSKLQEFVTQKLEEDEQKEVKGGGLSWAAGGV